VRSETAIIAEMAEKVAGSKKIDFSAFRNMKISERALAILSQVMIN